MLKRVTGFLAQFAILLGACTLFAYGQPSPADGLPATQEQVGKRLTAVGTLIERSSAARQIEVSGVAEAAARRNDARELHRRAEEAYRAANYGKATELLAEASKKLFEGVRLAAPEQVTGQKQRGDFEARLASVRALQTALKNIILEKKAETQGKESVARIESIAAAAARLEQAGKIDEARALLDQAYLVAKVAIEGLRRGDTLIRSLKFESKEEEYRYEIDRNDTHQMLVKMLLEEKRAAGSVDAMVRIHVDEALKLRGVAEESAGQGDYENAIKMLDQSTGELVRSIRRAGIYIPG